MERWARLKYQPNLPLGENRTYVTACQKHLDLSRRAAGEGMVLLKNDDHFLPLEKGTPVALFGKASFDYVQGGGGSGEVHSSYCRNLHDGLALKGDAVHIFEPLSDYYRENVADQIRAGAMPGLTVEPDIPADLLEKAVAFTDTAVISICRFSGEGWDRTPASYDSHDPSADALAKLQSSVFEDGDFFLTHAERRMVDTVFANFRNIIVILNIGGIMDTSWFRNSPSVKSALIAWSAGQEGGSAMADLLVGDVNPSGKLADTLAERLEDYPFSADFHESNDYVNYTEDIYVGYRYFETIPKMADRVVYPFGYGLSYTTFTKELSGFELPEQMTASQTLLLHVTVTNTGEYAGKEVVQIYVSAPQGKLGRPKRELAAFGKTRILAPGEHQTLTLEIAVRDLAAYDDLGKIRQSAWVLEQGTYHFYLGGDVRSAVLMPEASFCLQEDVVTEQLKRRLQPKKLPKRLMADGLFEELPVYEDMPEEKPEKTLFDPRDLDGVPPKFVSHDGYHPAHEVKEGCISLRDVAEGRADLDSFMDQLSLTQMAQMLGGQPNTGVAVTFGIGNLPEYGVPNAMTCDGPAGVRIFPEMGVSTTCFPGATLLACTWDRDLIREIGAAGASEVKENNMAVWLTPSINIHRTPLCGRNFEYYSEDPLISGILGGAMVEGIQSKNISACVKHFAVNNKETNRKESDSRVSERAAREIYLRGFELIVKKAHPWAVMSSYNKVNGVRTSQCHELLTDILRDEWGFDGVVTTDWWNWAEQVPEILAGNDLKMALGYPDQILAAVEDGTLTRDDIRKSVRRILELILKLE